MLILWCGFAQHNYCNIFIYMLACLILGVQLFMSGGLAVQQGKPISQGYQSMIKNVDPTVTLVFAIVIMVFYAIAVFISFRAYREFKYSHQMQRGAGNPQTQNPMNYGTLKD